jgi:hypothetical protein
MGLFQTVQASPGLNTPAVANPIANRPVTVQGGLFPPNSNSAGATTIQAEMSKGNIPACAISSNEGLPNQTLLSQLSTGTDGGTQANAANGIATGSGFSGGTAGIGGAGGANTGVAGGVVGDVCLGGQAAPANITYAGGTAATQFGGSN